MKLDNIFVGFTKDGKEHIFYKRYGYINDVSCTLYIDLETKEQFDISDVDTDSLVPVVQALNLEKSKMFKRKVVKAYKSDRKLLLDASGLFYGDLCRKNILEKQSFGHKRNGLVSYISKTVKEDALFAHVNDPYGRVQELKTSKLFFKKSDKYVLYSVLENRRVNYEHLDGLVQPKRKILEMDYKKEL